MKNKQEKNIDVKNQLKVISSLKRTNSDVHIRHQEISVFEAP